mmetsp:Transcript_60158/g.99336  ORF Transcript_60158/g.99336 Transcript_60158/m.99336 type:complete len:119 (+) Transcript_60158:124-480(+)|eukprot:CAMPEP_0202712194 /NCGR_PEP_ID=MMETSP1385-20130828/35102_1 /ASSEMBLY_ACC=CAM_ASM_000861 /TAXON_ID=933848 /ORGANISM="Elphidium margaritaceum" /LENGTH=118 /DNA_ID=CAMNT_0049372145 /DNA_START=124 /DNA_END=480 /DNA_ORIENTATION=+
MPKQTDKKKKKSKTQAVETTIHIRRKVRNCVNHKKTPRAIKTIRKHAQKMFKVKMVKIDTSLNKIVWQQGVKRPPSRIRIKFAVKRLRGQGNKPCIVASHVPVQSFHFLKTKKIAGGK